MLETNCEKIEIDELLSNSAYTEIAFFVDRQTFIDAVKKAREEVGLNKLVSYDAIKHWYTTICPGESLNLSYKLNQQIQNIKNKFGKGILFTKAIKSAILCGVIKKSDIQSSVFCLEYPIPEEFEEFNQDEPLVAILVSPNTKFGEVKKLMATEVKTIFRNKAIMETKNRISSNIIRDRRWYWMHKKGMSFQKISNSDEDSTGNRDTVIKAIKQYENRLVCKEADMHPSAEK